MQSSPAGVGLQRAKKMETSLSQVHQKPISTGFKSQYLEFTLAVEKLSAAPTEQPQMVQAAWRRFQRGEMKLRQDLKDLRVLCSPPLTQNGGWGGSGNRSPLEPVEGGILVWLCWWLPPGAGPLLAAE